jgi:hypothetical protein
MDRCGALLKGERVLQVNRGKRIQPLCSVAVQARWWPFFLLIGYLRPLLRECEPMISFRSVLRRRCVTTTRFSSLLIDSSLDGIAPPSHCAGPDHLRDCPIEVLLFRAKELFADAGAWEPMKRPAPSAPEAVLADLSYAARDEYAAR